MKMLQVHNHYQQTGGEDTIVQAEKELLEAHGHTVIPFRKHNDSIDIRHPFKLAAHTLWNPQTRKEIERCLEKLKPDVVHCHNTFPVISPSVYFACNRFRVPVVQTLHNYRYSCANGYFLRNNLPCEHCLRHPYSLMPAFWRCYRHSASATSVQLGLRWTNRLLKTYSKHIDAIIVLTNFAREKLLLAGIRPERIFIKPNSVDDPLLQKESKAKNDTQNLPQILKDSEFFVYVGRLSSEKGILSLLDAWRFSNPNAFLVVIGDGPLQNIVTKRASEDHRILFLGRQNREFVFKCMQSALAVVVPSLCYEAMPTAILESFANGTPVIASNHGAMSQIVENNRTGLLFNPGSDWNLAELITYSLTNINLLRSMGKTSRQIYLEKYTQPVIYEQLMNIYTQTIENRHEYHY